MGEGRGECQCRREDCTMYPHLGRGQEGLRGQGGVATDDEGEDKSVNS